MTTHHLILSSTSSPVATLLHLCGITLYTFHSIGTSALQGYLPFFPQWQILFKQSTHARHLSALQEQLVALNNSAPIRDAAYAEYERLAHHPALPVPLWEAAWLAADKALFSPHTHAVQQWYAQFGLEQEGTGQAADHIGLELLFLALLANKAQAGDTHADSAFWLFFEQHPSLWGKDCLHRLAQASTHPFWQHLTSTGAGLLDLLAQSIKK